MEGNSKDAKKRSHRERDSSSESVAGRTPPSLRATSERTPKSANGQKDGRSEGRQDRAIEDVIVDRDNRFQRNVSEVASYAKEPHTTTFNIACRDGPQVPTSRINGHRAEPRTERNELEFAYRIRGSSWDTPRHAEMRGETLIYPTQGAPWAIDSHARRSVTNHLSPRVFPSLSGLDKTKKAKPDTPSSIQVAQNHGRPPSVRKHGSLRVRNRVYQDIEGVPTDTHPFANLPIVRHPVDGRDTGFGPAPHEVEEAPRRKRGINNYTLAQAALRDRLMNHHHTLRLASRVSYHQLWSQAPPDFVDIRLLGRIEISAAELMTYFPAHHNWYDYYHRLWENGWERGHISGYINWARNRLPPDVFLSNSLSTYVKHMNRIFHAEHNPRCKGTEHTNVPVTDFTLRKWEPSPHIHGINRPHLIDYPVIELARGVSLDRLPRGIGRGLLTRTLEEVIRTNDHELMLSQVEGYVMANGINRNVQPMPQDADARAYREMKDVIVEYRAELDAYAREHKHTFN